MVYSDRRRHKVAPTARRDTINVINSKYMLLKKDVQISVVQKLTTD
jgi:hypothetical protein